MRTIIMIRTNMASEEDPNSKDYKILIYFYIKDVYVY